MFQCLLLNVSRLIILSLLLTGASSCKSFRNAQPPTVDKISDFKVSGFKEGQLQMSFKTRLNNPDRLRFKIRKVNMDLMFNGIRVAQISTKRKMTIRRITQPEIDWAVGAELKPLLSNPLKLAGNLAQGKFDFGLEGQVTISKWCIQKTLPVKLKLPVTIPLR